MAFKLGKEPELLNLHRDCFEAYLEKELAADYSEKVYYRNLYENNVNSENIRLYFQRPISTFIVALALGKLDEIANYTKPSKTRKVSQEELTQLEDYA